MQKNAKGQLQSVCSQLQSAQGALQQGMSTVEKQQNKQELEKAFNAVKEAKCVVDNALNNYQD